MSLAEITARIAGELADLRAQDVAVRRELDRLAATLAARDERIDALGAELEAARERLEGTARRLDSSSKWPTRCAPSGTMRAGALPR